MNPLAVAILILEIVRDGLKMRLRQYDANPALLKIDADNAEDLAEIGGAVLDAIVQVGAATDAALAGVSEKPTE